MDSNYASKDDIIHLRELMEQHDEMAQTAIDKAEKSVDERLKGMNEFREQLNQMIATLATKEQMMSLIDAVNIRIDGIEKSQSESRGRDKALAAIAILAAGFIGSVVSHLLKW